MPEDEGTSAAWAAGKSPWWRAVVLAWVGFAAVIMIRHDLTRDPEGASALFVGILAALDYHIHEFGHLAFGAFGLFVGVLGGSLMQLLLPVGAAVLLFVTQRDWFALSFCGAWLALGLGSVATYCADARALELDLMGLGDGSGDSGPYTGHDWNYLLSTLGWLKYDVRIAGLMRLVAALILVASVAHALRLFWLMKRAPQTA